MDAVLVKPDVLRAHALLAAVDPTAANDGLFEDVLAALLTGAGADCGAAVDMARPDAPVVAGFSPRAEAIADLTRAVHALPHRGDALPRGVVAALFGGEATDPRAIPLTAGDDTLGLVLLPSPPADPVGFASVTAHAAALVARIRMSERVREADFELKYRVWELESLYDVGLSIAGTLDVDSLADDILLKSISLLNARKGTLVVRDVSGDGRVLTKEFGGLLLTAEAALELPDEVVLANSPAERIGALAEAPAEKLLAVSIQSDGRRLGVLVVADKENRAGGVDDFNESDKRILSLFANQAAIALENARLHREALEKERMEREIELAASIQKTILPDALPSVAGLELAGGNRPTRQVGGDYFDVFPLPDGRTAVCVADVSGKGVPAALLVSTVHACLHLLVADGEHDLSTLVARTNRHLARFSATRKFVTLFVAVFDPLGGSLRYVNAGHNPGLLLSGDLVRQLPASGLPIGMFPQSTYSEVSVSIGGGDLLALYSDGITEAVNAADEEFGMERLTRILCEGRSETTAELSHRIFGAVDEFTRGVAQYDDQTVLVARVI